MGATHSKVPDINDKVVKLEAQDRYVVITFESGIKIHTYCGPQDFWSDELKKTVNLNKEGT